MRHWDPTAPGSTRRRFLQSGALALGGMAFASLRAGQQSRPLGEPTPRRLCSGMSQTQPAESAVDMV